MEMIISGEDGYKTCNFIFKYDNILIESENFEFNEKFNPVSILDSIKNKSHEKYGFVLTSTMIEIKDSTFIIHGDSKITVNIDQKFFSMFRNAIEEYKIPNNKFEPDFMEKLLDKLSFIY